MSIRRRTFWTVAASGLVLALSAAAASAETLAEAVALAYQTNPTLQEQRARLRALDETYVQARTGYRPGVETGASVTYRDPDSFGENRSGSATLSADQPLFTSGRVSAGVRAAEADVLAGRERLRGLENSILQQVIQVYSDVRRDVEALRIRQENVGVLQRQLEEASARFEVGEITRTDVAQAEARLAAARAELATAQAQLSVSRAAYAAVVGQAPGDLAPEPGLPGVPGTFDEALNVAQDRNPTIVAAEYDEAASRARVSQARAANGPSVGLSAQYGANFGQFDKFPADWEDRDAVTATATVRMPLFTGGLNSSRIRAALEQNNGDLIAIEGARRDTLRTVSNAWASIEASRASLAANEEQVRAARIAAEGVRQEAQVGLRTTLDVLNAEQELRAAELSLIRARRDLYVAQSQLLAAMGRLEVAAIAPGAESYDPTTNFNRVRNKGSVPWEPVVEVIDSFAEPSANPKRADDPDAPIDQQLDRPLRTRPRD